MSQICAFIFTRESMFTMSADVSLPSGRVLTLSNIDPYDASKMRKHQFG